MEEGLGGNECFETGHIKDLTFCGIKTHIPFLLLLLLPGKELGSSQTIISSAGEGSVMASARPKDYVQVDKT